MYTFRFNPVFEQWVMLGQPVPQKHLALKSTLDIGKQGQFGAVNHPGEPFLLEPKSGKQAPKEGLLYAEQSPVGEYELLVHTGDTSPFFWDAELWEQWLHLLQQRLKQFEHNPYLHHVQVSFHTGALNTVGAGRQRVGDVVATSHPISGSSPLLPRHIAHGLKRKEGIFHIIENQDASLYVASAPLFSKEVWYVPEQEGARFAAAGREQRQELAGALALLLRRLHLAYDQDQYVITLHTALIDSKEEATWWLQLHQADNTADWSPLSVRALPENFVQTLRALLHPKS